MAYVLASEGELDEGADALGGPRYAGLVLAPAPVELDAELCPRTGIPEQIDRDELPVTVFVAVSHSFWQISNLTHRDGRKERRSEIILDAGAPAVSRRRVHFAGMVYIGYKVIIAYLHIGEGACISVSVACREIGGNLRQRICHGTQLQSPARYVCVLFLNEITV